MIFNPISLIKIIILFLISSGGGKKTDRKIPIKIQYFPIVVSYKKTTILQQKGCATVAPPIKLVKPVKTPPLELLRSDSTPDLPSL